MKVLIADDEKLIVDDLTVEVRTLFPEARVDGAVNAKSALRLAESTEYDVALLDIDLPDMDGLTLARKLIDACPAINIIFVTGYREYALEAHELYCSAFLTKPVSGRKLRQAFENLRKPFLDLPEGFLEEHYSGNAAIGRKLELFREQRQLTRQDLSELMGVTRQTVFRWEQGVRMPDILTFIRLTRILGIRLEDVFEETSPVRKNQA